MTDPKEQLVVRLKYDPQNGWKMRRYCYLGHVFRAGPDWTPVSKDVAAHLRTVKASPSNDHALPAFEIMSQAEANALLEAERERDRPSMPGDSRPVVGGASTRSTPPPAPNATQALAELVARMRRGDELSDEEQGLIQLLQQTPSSSTSPPPPASAPAPIEGRSLLDDPNDDNDDDDSASGKSGGKKSKKKRK